MRQSQDSPLALKMKSQIGVSSLGPCHQRPMSLHVPQAKAQISPRSGLTPHFLPVPWLPFTALLLCAVASCSYITLLAMPVTTSGSLKGCKLLTLWPNVDHRSIIFQSVRCSAQIGIHSSQAGQDPSSYHNAHHFLLSYSHFSLIFSPTTEGI